MERKTSKGEKYRVKLKKSLILRKFKAVYICRMCVNKLSLMYLNTNTCEGELCLGICYFRPIKRNLKILKNLQDGKELIRNGAVYDFQRKEYR